MLQLMPKKCVVEPMELTARSTSFHSVSNCSKTQGPPPERTRVVLVVPGAGIVGDELPRGSAFPTATLSCCPGPAGRGSRAAEQRRDHEQDAARPFVTHTLVIITTLKVYL